MRRQIPRTSLTARKTRKKPRKKINSIAMAIKLSEEESNPGARPPPNEDRPSARRKIASKLARVAVVTGDAFDSERDVVTEGSGRGMWVARNIW